AARQGEIDVLYTIGGNLYETMPDPASVAEAFALIPLRVHQDIVLNTSALLDPAETVLVLPAQTRYEQEGGGTSTSTERRVRFARMPNGRARFSVVPLPGRDLPDGAYWLLTRRGKQFNTITYGPSDPLTGARTRSTVLLHPDDVAREGLREGQTVRLVSPHGE